MIGAPVRPLSDMWGEATDALPLRASGVRLIVDRGLIAC